MKRKTYIFTLVVIMFFAACDKSDIEYGNGYEKSYKAWLNFKESSNNSYKYVVTAGTWVGASWQTTITVTNGEVTQRDFKYTHMDETILGNLPEDYLLEWTENKSELNTHEHWPAAVTLDEIYDIARKEWLIKRENAETYFETNNAGMISSCGYIDDNCQDDCFRGITISSIEPVEAH